MKRKIHLRKKYIFKLKQSKKNILILSILLVIGIGYLIIKTTGDLAVPPLKKYAKNEASKVTNIVVHRTVDKVIEKELDIDNLYIINRDNNKNINMIDFNAVEVNKLLSKVINNIQNNFQNVEKGDLSKINIEELGLENYDKNNLEKGIIYRIPLGIIFNNTLLSNFGPTIPIKINLNGNISGSISTKVTNYGINNALLEISINLEINQLVMLPITTEKLSFKTSIPVAMKLIQGIVPSYYFNGIDKNSNTLTVPIE